MSQPEPQPSEVVAPDSLLVRQRCAVCGARFEPGDTLVWWSQPDASRSVHEGPTASPVHARCVPPS
jgi:hypothetical protein